MLTQISMRSSKLSQMGKTLEQVEQKAGAATEQLDERRPSASTASRTSAKSFSEVEKRVQALDRHGHAGAAGGREADGARRRAAEAPPPGPAALVAGARDPGQRRRDQEGARRARGVPQPASAGADRDQAVGGPRRRAARRARPGARHRRLSWRRTTRKLRETVARGARKTRRPRPRRSRTSRRSSGR